MSVKSKVPRLSDGTPRWSGVSNAWCNLLKAVNINGQCMEKDLMILRRQVKELSDCGLESCFVEYLFGSKLPDDIEKEIAAPFFTALNPVTTLKDKCPEEEDLFKALCKLLITPISVAERKVNAIRNCIWQLSTIISSGSGERKLHQKLAKRLHEIIYCSFFLDPPSYFFGMWRGFYIRSMKLYPTTHTSTSTDFEKICLMLQKLGFTKHLEALCAEVAFSEIDQKLKSYHLIQDNQIRWDVRLETFMSWVQQTVISWMKVVLVAPGSDNSTQSGPARLKVWKSRIAYFVYERFGDQRVAELFEAIKRWPESKEALTDLRKCLEITQRFDVLQKAIKQQFKKRLLNPGPNTELIIRLYIKTISVFRLLDPTGVILQVILEPMSVYTQSRDDAVRALLKILTEKNLFHGAKKVKPKSSNDSDTEDEDPMDWQPKPVNYNPKSDYSVKDVDILGLLMSIFGNETMFSEEYRKMLGNQLVNRKSNFFDTIKEMAELELMKLRLGKDSLLYCGIMLRDLYNSKCINNHIVEKLQSEGFRGADLATTINPTCFTVTVFSDQFWPNLRNFDFNLPQVIKNLVEKYKRIYTEHKYMRSLNFKHSLGAVDLSLELLGETIDMKIQPAYASVLLITNELTEKKRKNGLDGWIPEMELVTECGVEKYLSGIVTFWLHRGVLRTKLDVNNKAMYRVCEGEQEEKEVLLIYSRIGQKRFCTLEEEMRIQMGSADESNELETIKYQILGLLTKFTKKSVTDLIHTLKIMNGHLPKSFFKQEVIEEVLQKHEEDGNVVCTDGLYSRR